MDEKEEALVDQKKPSQDEASSEHHQATRDTYFEITVNFLKIAVPAIISCIFLELTYFINTVYAGSLNDSAKLAGVGLGAALLNILAFMPLMGLNGAIETLVSQAYGANEMRLCGVYLNRGRLINTVCFVPLAVIMCFSKQILAALGQQPAVIDYAQEYIVLCLPGVYFEVLFDLKKRFLNCMGIAWVPMLAQVGGTILHILWCYLFVSQWGLGVKGLGFATAFTNLLMLVMITIYAHCLPRIKDSLFCFDRNALLGWDEYFKLGIPATVMICAEWWAFDILIFLAGILGVRQQASMIIIYQIVTETQMIGLGIQEASAALIGNQIGALNIDLAKKYAKVMLVEAAIIGAIISLLLWVLREQIALLFTEDKAVIGIILSIFPIYCVANVIDSLLMIYNGCVRALGLQTRAALIAIVSYYLVSLPTACLLTFVGTMQIKGLWLGLYLGVVLQLGVLVWMTARANWYQLGLEAQTRMREDSLKCEADPQLKSIQPASESTQSEHV